MVQSTLCFGGISLEGKQITLIPRSDLSMLGPKLQMNRLVYWWMLVIEWCASFLVGCLRCNLMQFAMFNTTWNAINIQDHFLKMFEKSLAVPHELY